MNSTREYWRSRARAINEKAALKRVAVTLEKVYDKGGLLQPPGHLFNSSALRDGKDGHWPFLSRQRWAIKPLGFVSCKHVMYCADAGTGVRDGVTDGLVKQVTQVKKFGQTVAMAALGSKEGCRLLG
ncbi:unnamed protein product, partial [Chrysoparadoxa australica]